MTRFKLGEDALGCYLDDTFEQQKPLRVSFERPDFVHRLKGVGKKNELIARAVKARAGLKVVDCTGGLGLDAFILAYLGCHVTIVERSPVLHHLLVDGLKRASAHDILGDAISRMSLVAADAKLLLAEESLDYDVAYLDPMFPEKHGSALVKGDMRMMQQYLGSDDDAMALLTAALGADIAKVVIKRPPRMTWDPPQRPNHVVESRNSRYEVFVNAA